MNASELPSDAGDVGRRLLQAWKAEVQAHTVYQVLAKREPDPRRAQLFGQMAAAEAKHRERIEARLKQLSLPIPELGSVRLSVWRRLQARWAPTERVLVAMEAAENVEVDEGYRRPTGDEATDRLFSEIRVEEQSHSIELREMRNSEDGSPRESAAASHLGRILAREKWHQMGGGWISGSIYGANDGLAAVFGIVSGVSGATGGSSFVLTAGLAGALALALSMATGAYLAERSEAEVAAANLDRERREIEENPDEEREELSLFYQLKGLGTKAADDLADQVSSNPDALLQLLAIEELGGVQAGASRPVQAALAAGLSTAAGAIIPVLPFFWLKGTTAVIAAAIVSLIAHFLVGAAKSLVTLRSWWSAGLEMTIAGIIVGSVTYAAGLLFQVR